MNNLEALVGPVYYPFDSLYNYDFSLPYDIPYLMREIPSTENIYYLVYDDKKDIRYGTLSLIFCLATFSSFMFFSFYCNTDTNKPHIKYKRVNNRTKEETEGTEGTENIEDMKESGKIKMERF